MKTLAALFILFISSNLFAQSAKVIVNPALCKTNLDAIPVFQALNNQLNISVNLCTGILFQIVGIPLASKKNNNKVSWNYKVILIDENKNITYTNKQRKMLKIERINNQLTIKIKESLYSDNNKKIKLQALIKGTTNMYHNYYYE